jgi:hypothetical protein
LLDELRQLRPADEGYTVTTNGSQATFHKVNAQCISTTNFRLKVDINESNKEVTCGSTASPAPPKFPGAKRCKVRKREVMLVDGSTLESTVSSHRFK